MGWAQILTEEVWRIELVNNDSRFLLGATSHRNIMSISNTLNCKFKHVFLTHLPSDQIWRGLVEKTTFLCIRASYPKHEPNVLCRSIRDFFTFSMLSSLTEVNGWLAWSKFSTTSKPSLNALCHSNTCVLDRVDIPKDFCNIFNDSVAVILLETQNFKQTRSSILFP